MQYLYDRLPMFQRVGPAAYKKDLKNTIAICEALGNPHLKFKSVHVAGTNGKGSTSHMLASILQSARVKSGLYTSPHLKSFAERMRINGQTIDEDFVVDFVERTEPLIERLEPSFFELTTAMGFEFFATRQVDLAVVEVGLGGRLDCTNVIKPLVSVITSIGLDHQALLGNTLHKIASEKAGIIKAKTPVVISQTQASVIAVFQEQARKLSAPIQLADQVYQASITGDRLSIRRNGVDAFDVQPFPLMGAYQEKNVPGVLSCIDTLVGAGWKIGQEHIIAGLRDVVSQTGLKGRWQQLGANPLIICDTGHNEDGIREVVKQISGMKFNRLFIIFGMVNDKDPAPVLKLLPSSASYYFCESSVPRSMKAMALAQTALPFGLSGKVVPNVNDAIEQARQASAVGDMIFIGGSTFLVADIDGL